MLVSHSVGSVCLILPYPYPRGWFIGYKTLPEKIPAQFTLCELGKVGIPVKVAQCRWVTKSCLEYTWLHNHLVKKYRGKVDRYVSNGLLEKLSERVPICV